LSQTYEDRIFREVSWQQFLIFRKKFKFGASFFNGFFFRKPLKTIGKSKRVKGIFSRLQWHLAEGWRIWFYGVWFFRSLPLVEMISR